jgi:hypothetical protein
MGDEESVEAGETGEKVAPLAGSKPALPRGPRGEPGRGQHRPGAQLKRAWYSSGKRQPLKAFAKKHRPELFTAWRENKKG